MSVSLILRRRGVASQSSGTTSPRPGLKVEGTAACGRKRQSRPLRARRAALVSRPWPQISRRPETRLPPALQLWRQKLKLGRGVRLPWVCVWSTSLSPLLEPVFRSAEHGAGMGAVAGQWFLEFQVERSSAHFSGCPVTPPPRQRNGGDLICILLWAGHLAGVRVLIV